MAEVSFTIVKHLILRPKGPLFSSEIHHA